jgi:beta-lactam-binding protein with PASTA domain
VRDSDEARDTVIATNPPAGTQVEAGTTITVIVSRGQVAVPNVVGQSEDDARSTLEDAGFEVQTTEEPDATVPEGQVSAQSIPEGQRVAPETTITITVSTNTGDEDPGNGNGNGNGEGNGNGNDSPGPPDGEDDAGDGDGVGDLLP